MSKLYSLNSIELSYQVYDSELSEHRALYALHDISIDIFENEFVAIVGENGSGKSTLGKILAGLAGKFKGDIFYGGRKVDLYNRGVFSDVGMVIQEPQNQLLMPTVRKELAYPLENRGWYKTDIDKAVAEYASMFGLTELLESSPDRLSGGQITSLALASILITGPKVIILDEPDSHFDSASRNVLRRFINENRGKKTIILITQYIDEAKNADRIIALKGGGVLAQGTPDEVLNSIASTNESVSSKNKPAYDSCNDKLLVLENISYTYEPGRPALKNINLQINKGDRLGIVGEMGSGKTTLGLIIAGLIKPERGSISLNNTDIKDYDETILRGKIAYSMQFPERALFEETVTKDVAFGPSNINRSDIAQVVERYLSGFKIGHLKNRHPFSLSGGEKRRAALAGILAMDTDIVIFDEPTAALDYKSVNELTLLLHSLSDKTIIIISHDMDFITANCDRIIELRQGEIISDKKII